jgi:hypothetical protein
MGKVLTVVVGAVLFAAAFVGAGVFFTGAHPQSPQEAQAQLEKDVAAVKKSLPQDYGPAVTWFDAEAQWHTIVYKYKIHAPREVVVAKKKELEAQLKSSMLLQTAMYMMPKDVKMKYEMYDDGGHFIYTLDLD